MTKLYNLTYLMCNSISNKNYVIEFLTIIKFKFALYISIK